MVHAPPFHNHVHQAERLAYNRQPHDLDQLLMRCSDEEKKDIFDRCDFQNDFLTVMESACFSRPDAASSVLNVLIGHGYEVTDARRVKLLQAVEKNGKQTYYTDTAKERNALKKHINSVYRAGEKARKAAEKEERAKEARRLQHVAPAPRWKRKQANDDEEKNDEVLTMGTHQKKRK